MTYHYTVFEKCKNPECNFKSDTQKDYDDEELAKIWEALDSRISTLNKRTKAHTIYIRELRKQIELNKMEDKK
ncbi:MAG TPA: hypothetical protein VMZ91_11540 [Candidatus Paceibacterota bacterium]|nr:hypothetical protein [Candidatus Paceibacterota bacterium]